MAWLCYYIFIIVSGRMSGIQYCLKNMCLLTDGNKCDCFIHRLVLIKMAFMFTSSPVNNFDGIAGLRFIQVYLTALVTNSAVYNFVSTT